MFVRGPNPIWFFNNLTGSVLNDTYFAFFLTNDLPYVPQAVYQDPNGLIPWSDPIEFQPSGGLPNNLYFNETLVYRIEVRQGPDQTYPLIWLIENYVPTGSGTNPSSFDALITASNMITNPEFQDIYFSSPFTFTQASAGTYTIPIGPGWNLILNGAGTTILSQHTLPGSSDIAGNPAYYIEINNSLWTSAILQQTFSNNGALFGGGAVAVSFTAQSTTTAENITVQYAPSTASVIPTTLFFGTITTGGFDQYFGASDIPVSTNTDTGQNAFVNINFNIAGTGIISFSNIQIVGQSVPLSSSFISPSTISPGSVPLYQEESYERIVDHEFHSYRDSIIIQSKDTLLTGWSFSLNPYQFITTAITTQALVTNYVADQTIIHQELASQLQTGNASAAQRYALQVQPVVAATNTRFALIQYIDPATILPYWGYIVSSLAKVALISTKSPVTNIRLKMRLIWNPNLPPLITATEPIASWAANSDPVFSAGWTAILPINDPVYVLQNTTGSVYPDFSFNGFQLPANTSGTQTLGIVIYTMDNMNSAATVDQIIFDKISLVPNEFSIDANVQTYDQVLRQCQFYYEKSYDPGVLPGTSTFVGIKYASNPLGGDYSSTVLYKNTFQNTYLVPKRAIPGTINIYTPGGAVSNLQMGVYTGSSYPSPVSGPNPVVVAISNWSIKESSINSFAYVPNNTTPIMSFAASPGSDQGEIYYHFTANSLLGI